MTPDVDLTTTPPPPSPTIVVKEYIIPISRTTKPLSLIHPYFQKLSTPLQYCIKKDNNLQQFINKLPSVLPYWHKLKIKRPVLAMEAPQSSVTITDILDIPK